MKVTATVESPKIVAVRIRHDMCPLCKSIDPELPELIRAAAADSVLFVTLDFSDTSTQQQAALLVGALGLEGVWTGDLSKMGSVTFVEWTSKRIISSVQTAEIRAIRKALRKAVASLDG